MGRPRSRPLPVIGQEFNKWKVEKPGPKYSLCKCVCGIVKEVYNYDLLDDKSIMCSSCANEYRGSREPRLHKRAFPDMDRGLYRRLKGVAARAIQRCMNPNNSRYKDYGGRGIKVYQEWIDNNTLFVKYLTTLEGHENSSLLLDRINNEGHYEPGNLRFTDSSTSAFNRRNIRTPNGSIYSGNYSNYC